MCWKYLQRFSLSKFSMNFNQILLFFLRVHNTQFVCVLACCQTKKFIQCNVRCIHCNARYLRPCWLKTNLNMLEVVCHDHKGWFYCSLLVALVRNDHKIASTEPLDKNISKENIVPGLFLASSSLETLFVWKQRREILVGFLGTNFVGGGGTADVIMHS